MMKIQWMLTLGWMLQCAVQCIHSEQSPYFSVTGMADQLSNLCSYDYNSKTITIQLEVITVDCDMAVLNNSVVNTTWNFYPLTHQNGYTINENVSFTQHKDGLSPLVINPKQEHINIYAVQIIVNMDRAGESSSHKLNGYVNVGCRSNPEASACQDNRYNIKSLDGIMLYSHTLPSCSTTTAVYKASSTVEFELHRNLGSSVNYTVHDLISAGVYLDGKSNLVFEVQSSGDAYILLHEVYNNYTINSTEIIFGAQNNTALEIRNQTQGDVMTTYEETNIVSDTEYRSFWLSWAGNTIRVGKGDLPFLHQLLSWDGMSHGVKFVSIGVGSGQSGDWKFSADVCLQKHSQDQCTDSVDEVWYYNPVISSCIQTTCAGNGNCFTSADICNKTCSGTPALNLSQWSEGPAKQKTLLRNKRSLERTDTYDLEKSSTETDMSATGSDTNITDTNTGEGNTNTSDSNTIVTEDNIEVSTVPMEISCKRNCDDEKHSGRVVKFLLVCDNCTWATVDSYTWTVNNCASMDIATCTGNETNIEVVSTSKRNNFIKEEGTNAYIYGIFVKVNFTDGTQGSASMLFKFSPQPTTGSCEVLPETGYSLITDYNITCTGFTVPEGYSLDYIMRANTIDQFQKGSLFYSGNNSEVDKIKLQPGDSALNYTLYIWIKARMNTGVNVLYSTSVQVFPSSAYNDSTDSVIDVVKVLIDVTDTGQQSLIGDLITDNKTVEAVQYLNIITTSINTDTNTTSTNDTEDKIMIRTAVVSSLQQVSVDSYDTMSSITTVLNEATQQVNELSEETQDKAVDMYDSLASSLDSYQNASTEEELTETASDILTGVTNLLDLKVDQGTTTLAANDSETEQEMEKVKEGAGKLLNTVDKLGGTLLSLKIPGEGPTVLNTDSMSVSVEKKEPSTLSGHTLSSGSDNTSFIFPADMSAIDTGGSDCGIQMVHMKKNPYIWDESANNVNMGVLSVDLKTGNGSSITVNNMTQPLKISLQAPSTQEPTNSSFKLHLVKTNYGVSFNLSTSNMMSFNFTVKPGQTTTLQLLPVTTIRKLKIYITDIKKPSFQNISDVGHTYPDQIQTLSTELSDFKLTNFSSVNQNFSEIFISYKNLSSNYSGVHYVGITVDIGDNSTLEDMGVLDPGCIGNVDIADCVTIVDIVLKVKTTTLSCTYWDVTVQQWKTDGCEVSPFSTSAVLECLCTHMTSFAGGVFVLPNFVDPIADAELFLTFFDNPVVVTAVLVVWMLYFFLIHWARRADKLDLEKVGVIAVEGSDMVNGYVYLICVVTGWWSEAGTTSTVFYHMTGSKGSSKRVKLSTSHRTCFQTGSEDWFLISTEESLGDLDDVTLWHDNTGDSPHWYLSQVYVKDLRAKKSWTFIYNDWLAVDRGQLFRTTATISSVTEDQLKNQQKHNFVTKSTQDLRNTHIWISIFSKPARSSFTRVQRLTCALSLLLCTMLTNIMFYGIPTDDPDDQISAGGEFAISLSSIVIGIQSSLIMFPVNIIIMQMFLKLKKKPVKKPSCKEAVSVLQSILNMGRTASNAIIRKFSSMQAASSKYVVASSSAGSNTEKKTVTVNVDHSASTSSGSSTSTSYHTNPSTNPSTDTLLSDTTNKPSTNTLHTPSVTILSEEKQTGKILPWWFLYIAWTLVLTMSVICSFFVMLYGLKYGYQTSVEWLVSFFTGFSQSAFVTQPIKVLAVAIIITLIFKKAVEFEDFGPEVLLDSDEEYEKSVNEQVEPHIQYSQPLSARLLKQIKERVQLEWMMNMTLRDMGLYFIYITVVCIVVHGQRDIKQAYYNSLALEDVLINPGCINPNHCFFLEKVDNVEYFYEYLYDVAIPNLIDMSIADHEYATPGSNHFLVGPWRLRQLRVTTGSCGEEKNELYRTFDMNIPECSGNYWFGNEDNNHYNMSWSHRLSDYQDPPSPWIYQSAWKLKTIPFSGRLATYSGGGYIITMPRNSSLHEGTIDDMWNSDWIDERTRAVFLEFNLYNPNANLFSVVIILFEFASNGVVLPYHQIFSTKLYHYSNDFGVFVAVCECLFLIFNLSFTYIEWKKFSKLGKKQYFEDFWSYMEIIQIALSYTVVGLFFQRLVFVDSIMKKFRVIKGESFLSFYAAISWDLILGYVMAFQVAIVTIKAAKLLRFNRRTYMIADALSHSKSLLISFSVMAVILFFAFTSFATFAFGKAMYEYRDFLSSLITVFNLSLGVSDLPGLTETNRLLGPIFFVVFVFFAMFVFMTVFVAIINFGITESKAMLEQRKNKFELLEYVLMKSKALVNMR